MTRHKITPSFFSPSFVDRAPVAVVGGTTASYSTTDVDVTDGYFTSPVVSPLLLGLVRSLFSLYAFITIAVSLAWDVHVIDQPIEARRSFSYFTNLTYWSLGFYFLVSAIYTFISARRVSHAGGAGRGGNVLRGQARPLQFLYRLWHTTIITFPILVTLVYWILLYPAVRPFRSREQTWLNVSVHALNSCLFALWEITFTNSPAPAWLHLPGLILLLALYLGLAYVTRATQGFYTYSFLNPAKSGSGLVAGYVFGILVAITIIFLLIKGIVHLRILLWRKFGRTDSSIPTYKTRHAQGLEMTA